MLDIFLKVGFNMILNKLQSKKIQILRGLAIIAVVFIHNTPSGLSQVFIRPFLNFSVGLFLFLSGMLSNRKKWNPIKRIMKVIVPYVMWTFIYSVFNIIFIDPKLILVGFVRSIYNAKAACMLYYVFVYCQFTLLIPLIDKLGKSKFKLFGFFISPGEIIIMRLIPFILGIELVSKISTLIGISCLGWFSYFYLGYLFGNGYINFKFSNLRIFILWICSIFLQIIEGYFYYIFGYFDCGTQLKLSSILSGILFCMLAYNYIMSDKYKKVYVLKLLGDNSFGIYFSHIAVMIFLNFIPYYTEYVIYPFNAIVAVVYSTIFVMIGRKIFGKLSWIFAF